MAFSTPPPISAKKKADLSLCKDLAIPAEFHRFYSELPATATTKTLTRECNSEEISSIGLSHVPALRLGFTCQPEPLLSPIVTPENQHERLADVVTPLWRLPYEEQLQHKYNWALSVVKQFTTKLRLSERKSRPTSRRSNYFVPVNQVKASPLTEEYRNKDEFNIRTGVDGNPKTVGFFIGSPSKGNTVCVRGTNLINIKPSHKQAAQAYEDYIRISDLPACHDLHDGGHWRTFIVRSTSSGKLMATAVFHPQNMEHDAVEEEALKLREYFVHGAGAQSNLSSLYFQPCRNVNTQAASVLYETALKLANLTYTTTLLDVCCGTGTIGILASRYVRGVVGIDIVHDAVKDAEHNATLNHVSNAEFISGRAEKVIPGVIRGLGMSSEIVAVVNPGRSGLHESVIHALCETKQIQQLVYISCKADNANTMQNFVQLCHEGNFTLRKISPVDLFPHTTHTELVLLFKR
uniref:tRNA (uracil(54)-C(5))-methyltransferase n=1 Tax=Timema douglasi TaxID=61478 RepID=A0A7R8VPB3_TIMDO|nr:unnamed protein product [Timema douglasi]